MVDLKGKNVVYVGGYGGIGYACCKALVAKDIHCLAIVDVKQQEQLQQELEQLNSKVKVKFFALNLLDGKEAIESVLKDVVAFLGVIDVLVNGSGIADERYPRKIIDINLTGLVETTLLCIPLMSKENGGRGGLVVNIASVLGIEPCPTLCVYSASKHGVVGFTRSLAEPLYYEKTGIKYIAICPGFTDTPILNDLREDYTFEYAKPIVDALLTVKKQTAEECAANILKAIESTENGSVWLCDLGKLHKLDMKKYWETGPVETTLLCIPLMSKENGGRGGLVVNIASVAGLEPCPTLCVYSASKHGVVGFTRSLSEPLYYEKTGIEYIVICPGFTSTPIIKNVREDYTFEYSKPIVDALMTTKNQTSEECAANILKAIESAENGSVWICDLGKLQKLDMKKYWEVTF